VNLGRLVLVRPGLGDNRDRQHGLESIGVLRTGSVGNLELDRGGAHELGGRSELQGGVVLDRWRAVAARGDLHEIGECQLRAVSGTHPNIVRQLQLQQFSSSHRHWQVVGGEDRTLLSLSGHRDDCEGGLIVLICDAVDHHLAIGRHRDLQLAVRGDGNARV